VFAFTVGLLRVYRASACKAVYFYTNSICLSVRLFVCLSHSGIVSRWLNIVEILSPLADSLMTLICSD